MMHSRLSCWLALLLSVSLAPSATKAGPLHKQYLAQLARDYAKGESMLMSLLAMEQQLGENEQLLGQLLADMQQLANGGGAGLGAMGGAAGAGGGGGPSRIRNNLMGYHEGDEIR